RVYHYGVSNTLGFTIRETFDLNGRLLSSTNIGFSGFQNMAAVDRDGDGYQFYPLVVNAINHNDLLVGFRGLYRSTDQGDMVTPVGSASFGGQLTALAYGGREKTGEPAEQAAYVARGGKITSFSDISAGATGTTVAANVDTGATKITSIVMDPTNWRVAY